MFTSSETIAPHVSDPLYETALRHLQQGEWQAGLADLAQLVERYPLSHELRTLSQEMQVRAKVDQDEQDDHRRARRRQYKVLATRLLGVCLALALAAWGVRSYAVWLQDQIAIARQNLEQQIQTAALTSKFADAQALLRGGRPEEAKALLEEIAATDPTFPGLETALTRVEAAASLETRYAEAMGMIQQENWQEALSFLQAMAVEDPNYKDVALQIAKIEKEYLLQDMVEQAEAKYQARAWTEAASGYESVRALDLSYRPEFTEERLFTSYVNAARAALINQSDSLEALQIAEGYFRKALALRPQDPEIKTERELAGLYLKAQDDFATGRWTDVITGLEIIYSADPQYAVGTARQTLYEAYVARGDGEMANSEYEVALNDYQRALALAAQDKDAVLRLFEANLKAGDAQGAQDNFEAAVQFYRTAVELGGLRERAPENPSLEAALQEAEDYSSKGNFSVALERYRRAVRIANATQATTTHVVKAGEYLTLIASRYRSTVRAIALANNIDNPNRIYEGQELVIPMLP